MRDGQEIKNVQELKQVVKHGYCDVKIMLRSGMYSRKTVYEDLSVFNYIDETEEEFNTEAEAEAYWQDYFDHNIVVFDGYN